MPSFLSKTVHTKWPHPRMARLFSPISPYFCESIPPPLFRTLVPFGFLPGQVGFFRVGFIMVSSPHDTDRYGVLTPISVSARKGRLAFCKWGIPRWKPKVALLMGTLAGWGNKKHDPARNSFSWIFAGVDIQALRSGTTSLSFSAESGVRSLNFGLFRSFWLSPPPLWLLYISFPGFSTLISSKRYSLLLETAPSRPLFCRRCPCGVSKTCFHPKVVFHLNPSVTS